MFEPAVNDKVGVVLPTLTSQYLVVLLVMEIKEVGVELLFVQELIYIQKDRLNFAEPGLVISAAAMLAVCLPKYIFLAKVAVCAENTYTYKTYTRTSTTTPNTIAKTFISVYIL